MPTGVIGQRAAVSALVVATGLVAALLYLLAPDADRREQEVSALTLGVVPVDMTRQRVKLTAYGRAEAARHIPLLAQVPGTVSQIDEQFVSGGRVEQGSELVVLADEDYRLALAQRRNDVSAAQLHLEEVRAKARVARKVNGQQASDYALLKPHLAEAQTRVAAAEAALRSAQIELERTRVRAPFAGRLSEVRVKQGQVVAAGEQLGQLYTPDVLEVRLPVRDEWLALLDIPLDQGVLASPVPALFKARFGGQLNIWEGHLVRSEGGLDRNQMVVLVARIEASGDGLSLEPGVWLEAEILGRELPSLARLPRSVVGHDGAVWRVGQDQLLQRQPVELAYMDDDYAYVRSGLSTGDQVALSGDLRLLEGTRVEPVRAWMNADALGAR